MRPSHVETHPAMGTKQSRARASIQRIVHFANIQPDLYCEEFGTERKDAKDYGRGGLHLNYTKLMTDDSHSRLIIIAVVEIYGAESWKAAELVGLAPAARSLVQTRGEPQKAGFVPKHTQVSKIHLFGAKLEGAQSATC